VSLGHPSKFQRVSHFGFVTAATSLNRTHPNFALCSAISWPDTLCIHFRQLLLPDRILPYAKFTSGPSMHHCTSLSGYIFATEAHIDNWKNLLNSNISSLRVHIFPQYGELWPTSAEICWRVWAPQQISTGFTYWQHYCTAL